MDEDLTNVIYFIFSTPWKYHTGKSTSDRQNRKEYSKSVLYSLNLGTTAIHRSNTTKEIRKRIALIVRTDETRLLSSSLLSLKIATSFTEDILRPKLITILKYKITVWAKTTIPYRSIPIV